ncbi:MAG: TadE/TadG family type IV pilus assembly protein [Gemmataceae bacterium]
MFAKSRRGHVAIELLVVLPILLTVLLGTVEFSLLLTAQQQVSLASREATRVAATGGSVAEIEQAVRQTLGESRFAQATVRAMLTDSNGEPLASGEPIAVQVQLPATAAVPDLLVFAGISIRNQVVMGQTVMRKE